MTRQEEHCHIVRVAQEGNSEGCKGLVHMYVATHDLERMDDREVPQHKLCHSRRQMASNYKEHLTSTKQRSLPQHSRHISAIKNGTARILLDLRTLPQ